MTASKEYRRFARKPLLEALADTPVVLIHGPRQCGKTTLAKMVAAEAGYTYLTFDDEATLSAATNDPVGFIADLPRRVVLDEVQRAPRLFSTIKLSVDRDRVPGRFILTGSANIMLVPKLSDSLAGRIEILRLHPLAQCELARKPPNFLDRLFKGSFTMAPYQRLGIKLAERIVAGGYPAALTRAANRRRAWYTGYVDTLVQRDMRDLARISALDTVPDLLMLAAGQTARLFNAALLASSFQLSRPTIRDYLTLLETLFLVETLQPWYTNRISRLIKTPKLHVNDTGLAAALLGIDTKGLRKDPALYGQFLETFVYQEIRRQASWHDFPIAFHHFRDKDGVEVDIVLERGARGVCGVEVKASSTVTPSDFRGLKKLQTEAGARFISGALLYDGEHLLRFGKGLFAVPIRALWEPA